MNRSSALEVPPVPRAQSAATPGKWDKPMDGILLDSSNVVNFPKRGQADAVGRNNSEQIILTDELLRLLPENLIRRKRMLPLNLSGNTLTIAMLDTQDQMALDHVRLHAMKHCGKSVEINTVSITEDDYNRVLNQYFASKGEETPQELVSKQNASPEYFDVNSIIDEIDIEPIEEESAPEITDANAVPVVRLANAILSLAVQKKASDIHIEPMPKGMKVRYRLDGILAEEMMLPRQMVGSLISRFKIMSNLNIAEKRLPQDGRLRQRIKGRNIDFRVSTLPSKYGEHIVMRILDNGNTELKLDDLFLYPEMLETVREIAHRPNGIVFVTGPTGSGKTTTLYSILAERNTPDVHITTAEDPIEYELPGLTQVQAHPEIGMTFARILKAFLRQDPDIMLIGETRDKETASIAIESALTGHLVFTSLHTNDAPGAITRLQEMGIHGFLIASATIGVIAQRLVRKLCPDCKVPYQPDAKMLDYVSYRYKPGETVIVYQADLNGCDKCSKGYKGRIGVYEVMTINDPLRDLINRNGDIAQIRAAAKEAGMQTLKDYSLRLVADGFTSLEEVMRVTMSDQGQDNLCPHCRSDIESHFVRCPHCETQLKKLCNQCGCELRKNWKACPQCGINPRGTQPLAPLPTMLVASPWDEPAPPQHHHPTPQAIVVEKAVGTCPTCLSSVQTDWKKCPYCFTAMT